MELIGCTREQVKLGYRAVLCSNDMRAAEILTLNSLMLIHAWKYPVFRNILETAEKYSVDSTGIRIAERLVNKRKTDKYPGIEMAEDIISEGYPVFFWGGRPGVAKRAADELMSKYPAADIRGFNDGYFSAGNEDSIIAEINKSGADVLFIGLAMPAQQELAGRIKKAVKVKLIVGVGGSFDVFSRDVKRAPGFFIFTGTEWLWRTMQEPARLMRLLPLPYFILILVWRTFRKKGLLD